MPLLNREQERFLEALSLVRKYIPQFQVRDKEWSLSQRAIGWLLRRLGNPYYMDGYWTTIGYTTYRPSGTHSDEWLTILHEGCHAVQKKRWRVLFYLAYLFPQSLALIFVGLSVLFSWWWLLGLVCLLPWPAPFRWVFEREAYRLSLICEGTYLGDIYDKSARLKQIEENLSGPDYYWTWPFKPYKYFDDLETINSLYEEDCRLLAERIRKEDEPA